MPSGVILSSSSIGAKKEDLERVLAGAGLEVEVEEPETPEVPAEPARDDFDSEEAFEEAHVKWQDENKPEEKDEEEDDEEEEQPAPKAKLSKFKKRISRIVAPLERENADLKKRLEALEKGKKPGEEEPPPPEANPRPKRDKFKSDEEYEDALLAWGVTKATVEQTAKDAAKKQQETLAKNLKDYQGRVEEFKESHDDWNEVVEQELPMHTGV